MRYVLASLLVVLLSAACARGLGIGDDAHIQSASQVLAAPNEADLEAAFHARDVKDQVGLSALGQSGRVFVLINRTRVHVISAAPGRWKLRVIDGPHAGEAVWVDWDVLAP
jgi:hypothetical protein